MRRRHLTALLLLLTGCAAEPALDHGGARGNRGAAPTVAGEIAVEWRADLPRDQLLLQVKSLGVSDEDEASDTAGALPGALEHVASADEPLLLQRLRGNPAVAVAEPVYRYEKLFVPDDPEFVRQWHMQQIHAETAWDWGAGDDVIVAVIDTGVSAQSDLARSQLVAGYDFVHHRALADDDQGHGSHVAGTIAQATDNGTGVTGLAHRARIMPIKVLDETGAGSTVHIAEGIRWAVDHGAKVLNLSLGGGGDSEILARAVRYARTHGVIVVCAAGNGFGPPVSYPAAYDGAIAVSAVRFDRMLAPYSSFGPEVALAAPGGDTTVDQNHDGFPDGVLQQTLGGEFKYFQGTSMATPHVAAAAALLAGAGVTRVDAIQSILERTAIPLGDHQKYGAGEIDAGAALKHVRLYGGLWRIAIAVLFAFAARGLVRRRDLRVAPLGLSGALGLAITSSGLIILPLLGWGHAEWARIASTPLPEWGQLLFGSVTSNPVWLSALGPFLILGIARVPRLQGLAAGLCLGYAAYLAHAAAVGWVDLAWIPGRLIEAIWLAANAFTAFVLGMVALRPAR